MVKSIYSKIKIPRQTFWILYRKYVQSGTEKTRPAVILLKAVQLKPKIDIGKF